MIDRNKTTLSPLSHEYLAGFFDGEGTVGLYTDRKNGTRLRASVAILLKNDTRNMRLLKTIGDMYGVKVQQSRIACRVKISKQQTLRKFIADILPYTTIKTTQLILLDSWLENKTYGYRIHQILKSQKRRA